MAKWFAPRGGGYTGGDKPVPHGPPPQTPATGGAGYSAGHRPGGLRPPPWEVTRTVITDEGLLRMVIERDGLPMNEWGDRWAMAVSRMLLDLQKESKIGTSDTPHVPYLDAD